MAMSRVSWLCLLSIIALIAGSLYALGTGEISAGPFNYRKKERPVAFYTTLFLFLVVGFIVVAYIWFIS